MRAIGRRPVFFAALVVVSLLLYYPTPPEFRWVCVFCASLAAFWAVALGLEDLSNPGPPPPRAAAGREPKPASPFAPPPPPGARS